MRKRLSWNNKQADPYTMNQDRKQPAGDAYLIGGPSEFAEDIHEPLPDDVALGRNEIGMPNMSEWNLTHKDVEEWNSDDAYDNMKGKSARMDKEAARDVFARLEKKAFQCVKIAQTLLPTASEAIIEEQAYEFMSLPDSVVIATCLRLAEAEEDDEDEAESEAEASLWVNAGDDEDEEDDDDDDDEQVEAMLREMIAAEKDKEAEKDGEEDGEEEKEAAGKKGEDDEDDVDALIDDMLSDAEASYFDLDETDVDASNDDFEIEMEPVLEKMSHAEIQENDEVLRSLFAKEATPKKQASKPKGVQTLGGRVKEAAAEDDGFDLSKLWQTDPDVSDLF